MNPAAKYSNKQTKNNDTKTKKKNIIKIPLIFW